jgi:hypothetical protein
LSFLKAIPWSYCWDFFEVLLENTKKKLNLDFNKELWIKPKVDDIVEYSLILLNLYALEKKLKSNVWQGSFNKWENNAVFEWIYKNVWQSIVVRWSGFRSDWIAQLESVDNSSLWIEIFDILKENILEFFVEIREKEENRKFLIEWLSDLDKVYLFEICKIYNIDLSKELNKTSWFTDNWNDAKELWTSGMDLSDKVDLSFQKIFWKFENAINSEAYRWDIFNENPVIKKETEISNNIPKYSVEFDWKKYAEFYEIDLDKTKLKVKMLWTDI